MSGPTRAERIEGGLLGLLIGDALGMPYEFHAAEEIPRAELIEFSPPEGFRRSHIDAPPGTYSDDGATALALLSSVLDKGRLDPQDVAQQLVEWFRKGTYAVDGKVFDINLQTKRALIAFEGGIPALETGPTNERSNGNAGLLRVLPLALWHQGSDAELVADAHSQTRITNGHLRSQVGSALYAMWVRRLLDGSKDGWEDAVTSLRTVYIRDGSARDELEITFRPDAPRAGRGSANVVDALWTVRDVMVEDDYETVVRSAISLGNDTDGNAALSGGLAGIREGVANIPSRWREALRGREVFQPLLDKLLAHAAPPSEEK